eukprot:1974828-Rhodomonas_salina.2
MPLPEFGPSTAQFAEIRASSQLEAVGEPFVASRPQTQSSDPRRRQPGPLQLEAPSWPILGAGPQAPLRASAGLQPASGVFPPENIDLASLQVSGQRLGPDPE